MLKQGREVKTHISDLFRTSYGTVDITRLKSVFLNLSSWVEPIEELERLGKPGNKHIQNQSKKIHTTYQLPTTPFKD